MAVERRWSLFWRGLEALGIVFAIYAGWLAYQANNIAVQALRDQRVASAWQILSLPNGAGRRYALEALVNETDEVLVGVNFACSDVSGEGTWEHCTQPTRLDRLHLNPRVADSGARRQIEAIRLDFADLEQAVIEDITFLDSSFYKTKFDETKIARSDIIRSDFVASLPSEKFLFDKNHFSVVIEDTYIYDSSFSGKLWGWQFERVDFFMSSFSKADLSRATFGNVAPAMARVAGINDSRELVPLPDIDVSGAVFCDVEAIVIGERHCLKGLTSNIFDRFFYIEPSPPIGLELLGYSTDDVAKCKHIDQRIECEHHTMSWSM